jgi:hypothetical protein
MGIETLNAMAVVHIVPVIRGRTPKVGSWNRGVHEVPVRNSVMLTSRKNWIAGNSSDTTMPIVVRIDTPAATTRKPMPAFEPSGTVNGGRRRLGWRGPSSWSRARAGADG